MIFTKEIRLKASFIWHVHADDLSLIRLYVWHITQINYHAKIAPNEMDKNKIIALR